MPKVPPPGDGWELVYESSDQRVWQRDGEEWVKWVNPNAHDARLEDLEDRVTDLEEALAVLAADMLGGGA